MRQDDDKLRRLLQEATCIAVVGASDDEDKAAHDVPAYLQERGYRIIPVNPGSSEILGEPAFDDLSEVDQSVDVVEVFRPAEEAPALARKAAALGASVLWLQEGIVSEEAQRIAEEAGLEVVMDECMMKNHRRLVASGSSS
ncbi:MAG: CoA-binding protein [Actinobacteria bacterium]|nr:CoA-binding protein [Actinomycetota bacterium]